MSTHDVRTRSTVKGALAGLIGGLVGAAAKAAAEQVSPPRNAGQTSPPRLLVERVDQAVAETRHSVAEAGIDPGTAATTGRLNESAADHIPGNSPGHFTESQKSALATATHWTVGGLAGAAYGMVVEMNPATAAWQGAAFGLALNRITHEGALPALGLSAPTNKQSLQERYSERVTHVVFGVVTELVRRAVRKRL